MLPHQGPVDPADLTLGNLLRGLKPSQLWAAVASVFVVLSALTSAAYNVGSHFALPLSNRPPDEVRQSLDTAYAAIVTAVQPLLVKTRNAAEAAQGNTSDAPTCTLRASQSLQNLAPAISKLEDVVKILSAAKQAGQKT
jgi:hypothetical protein